MSIRIASWLAAAGCALALAGCGGGSEGTPSGPAIPAPIAEDLASQSDRIADLLAEGNTCEAARAADELNRSVEQAAGRIPAAFEGEIDSVVTELVNNVNCEEPEEEEKDEDKGKGKGNGKGNGNGNGDEEGSETGTTTVIEVTTG